MPIAETPPIPPAPVPFVAPPYTLPILAAALAVVPIFPCVAGEAPPPDTAALLAAAGPAADAPLARAAAAAMVAIPAATHRLGRDDGPAAERPAHAVALPAFRIDPTEVTNAAFAEFLNALALPPIPDFGPGAAGRVALPPEADRWLREDPDEPGRYPLVALDDAQSRIERRDGRFRPEPGFEDHPVTETTWAGARAFCLWRGARLPSEAEWEAAARAGEGRLYPWGGLPPTPDRARVERRDGATAPVGTHPAGATPAGLQDMAGNLAEWTASLRRPYPYDPADGREDPARAGERVTRGGDHRYDTRADRLTATHRQGFSNAPERGHRHIGLRCAADGAPA